MANSPDTILHRESAWQPVTEPASQSSKNEILHVWGNQSFPTVMRNRAKAIPYVKYQVTLNVMECESGGVCMRLGTNESPLRGAGKHVDFVVSNGKSIEVVCSEDFKGQISLAKTTARPIEYV